MEELVVHLKTWDVWSTGPRWEGNTSLNLDVRKRPLNWFNLLP